MTPTIAVDAADQWLAVIVDFSERALAVGAVHWKALFERLHHCMAEIFWPPMHNVPTKRE
jgi:hypothetical protein